MTTSNESTPGRLSTADFATAAEPQTADKDQPMANREQETRARTDLGERVIDVHHHWLPSELVERLERYLPPGYRAERRANGVVGIYDPDGLEGLTVDPERWCRPDVQLADMDAAGVDVALLSAARYPAWLTLAAARLLNDARGWYQATN